MLFVDIQTNSVDDYYEMADNKDPIGCKLDIQGVEIEQTIQSYPTQRGKQPMDEDNKQTDKATRKFYIA